MIYTDFEALVRNIQGCERVPERDKSYTVKTEWHVACGYAYIVVRCDGEMSNVYRGENAVEMFYEDILQEGVKIRESLAKPKEIVMAWKDWESFKRAADCHVCNKSLIKDEFLDSLNVWNVEKVGEESSKEASKEGRENWSYCDQGHKKNVFTKRRKNGECKG